MSYPCNECFVPWGECMIHKMGTGYKHLLKVLKTQRCCGIVSIISLHIFGVFSSAWNRYILVSLAFLNQITRNGRINCVKYQWLPKVFPKFIYSNYTQEKCWRTSDHVQRMLPVDTASVVRHIWLFAPFSCNINFRKLLNCYYWSP